MESFNLYLPCTKEDCYERGLQKYYVALNKKIELKGLWEVGLSEISFTKSNITIKKRQSVEIVLIRDDNPKISKINEYVEPGIYTREQLMERVNELSIKHLESIRKRLRIKSYPRIEKDGNSFKFVAGITEWGEKVVLWIEYTIQYPVFLLPSHDICEIFGFNREELLVEVKEALLFYKNRVTYTKAESDELIAANEIKVSKYPHKIFNKQNYLFVTSDICENRIFGEMKHPILRYINYDDTNFGSKKTIKYKNPEYLKLRKNPFQIIEIKLMKSLDHSQDHEKLEEETDLRFGEIYMVLSFRKVKDEDVTYERENVIPKVEPETALDPFEVDIFDPDTEEPPLSRPRIRP